MKRLLVIGAALASCMVSTAFADSGLVSGLAGRLNTATSGARGVAYQNSTSGTAARTVQSKLDELVSITDFAGVDSTCTNDSTAGIQAALNSGAKGVYVPQGCFKFSALTMPTTLGFRLSGAGTGSVLKQTGAGLRWPTGGSIAYQQGVIENLAFDGTSGTGHTISMAGVGGEDLRNLYFQNTPVGFDSIYVDGLGSTYTHDIRLSNIRIYTGTAGNAGVEFGPHTADTSIDDYIANGNFVLLYGMEYDAGAASITSSNSHPYNTKTHTLFVTGDGGQDGLKFVDDVFDNNSAGDVVSLNNSGGTVFLGGRVEAINNGYSGVTLNNSTATHIDDMSFDGQVGSVSAVKETGTSSGTLVLGGTVAAVANFSAPFSLSGAGSIVRFNGALNPYGSTYSLPFATQSAMAAGSTNVIGCNGIQASVAATTWVIPYASNFQSVVFQVGTAPGAGQTITVNLQVNGSTVASGTISGASSYGVTLAYTGAVAAGAQVSLQVVMSASAAATYGRGVITLAG